MDREGDEAGRFTNEGELSDSVHSDDGDGDIATISDVFTDILTANEDLLQAAAECQLGNDAPSILAYQRILHRNLIEMADFVDAMFGVYNQSSADKKITMEHQEDDALKDGEDTRDDNDEGYVASANPSFPESCDDANGHTSEETIEPTSAVKPKAKRQPERVRSLLIDRFRLENRRRSKQRSARLWKKMRRKVRVEEGVSVVMIEAVERIAQLTATGAALRSSVVNISPTTAPSTETLTAQSLTISSGAAALPTAVASASPQAESHISPEPTTPSTPQIVVASSDEPSTSSGPSTQSSPMAADYSASPSVPVATPTPPVPLSSGPSKRFQSQHATPPPQQQQQQQQQFPMSMLATSLPFASQGGALILPMGAEKFTKVALPSMASGLTMLYNPMAAVPTTFFAPDHMSTICSDCVPLNRTAHECRYVRKHITPSPLQQPQHAMMFNGAGMWPMAAMNGAMNGLAILPPPPVRVSPSVAVTAPNSAQFVLKRVCEECKSHHKSVHYCRKTLGHTAPEWLSSTSGAVTEPKRKRRSKKQREAESAAEKAAAACAAASTTITATAGVSDAGGVARNEV